MPLSLSIKDFEKMPLDKLIENAEKNSNTADSILVHHLLNIKLQKRLIRTSWLTTCALIIGTSAGTILGIFLSKYIH